MTGVVRGLRAAERVVAGCSGVAALLSVHAALNSRFLRRPGTHPPTVPERVGVCVPARNEERNIVDCVASILRSDSLTDFEVNVLDDGSSDRTGSLVDDIAGNDARVRLLHGIDALPAGWIGKPHAMEQLRNASGSAILAFVDADVRLEPAAIASAVAVMRDHGFAMVCPYPRQRAETPGERVVQPLLQWLWMTFLPLRLAEGLRPSTMVAANGQFMVVDANTLAEVGGFGSVRGEVLDDVALARVFKRAGHRVALVDGTHLATCRMYDDWSSLVAGYSKNLWAASGSPAGAFAFATVLAFAYLVPPMAAVGGLLTGRTRIAFLGAAGYLAGVGGRLISAHTTGANAADALLHPASIATLTGLLARSWRGKRNGSLLWKGRGVTGGQA